LVKEDLARGVLKTVKAPGWPLKRNIRIAQMEGAFVSKAVEHFLTLAEKKIPKARFQKDSRE